MEASNPWSQAVAWMKAARHRWSEGARLRRDAEEMARMDAHQLRDLGFSHAAAAGSDILLAQHGLDGHANWMHAQPTFRGHAVRRP